MNFRGAAIAASAEGSGRAIPDEPAAGHDPDAIFATRRRLVSSKFFFAGLTPETKKRRLLFALLFIDVSKLFGRPAGFRAVR
jgi:hypothetical protein